MSSRIEGAKKGGGSGGTESPDNLRSVQTARLVDLISEGPVKGLVNGLKSVYLDGVPIQNADGSSNFTGMNFGFLDGSPGQAGLPGFEAVENERAVAVEIRTATPVIQTIVNASVDAVRVTISVPQLTTVDTTTGNMTGSSFSYAIDVQSNGGGFVRQHTDTIAGKTTSNYKEAVRLKLPGTGPWDIKVSRLSAESTSSVIVNKFFWDSFTEIQSVKLRYPNSSVGGLQVSAEQFGRVPTRAYDLMGLIVRVPTNYDPIAGTYTGIWDGTFKLAWTNNPAWVFFDLATHPRYGLGRYIKDQHLDKWALYQIGRYCDERVPDGLGGTEPRFTCNLYLQTAVQARQALQDLAGLMRAIAFWGNGQIGVVQDAPADARMLFTKANITGDFVYQRASGKTKYSAWTVYYNDLSQMGRRMPVVHVARDLVKTMGVKMQSFSPIGCTSRGQALRLARWAELTQALGQTVSFRAGAEAAGLLPGGVFKVADPSKAGKRLGGRVSAATTTVVTLDADLSLDVGETYELEVMLVDPNAQLGYKTEKRRVMDSVGVRALEVTPPFSVAPSTGAIWVLQPSTIEPTWWRMVGRKEVEGGHNFDVIGVAHDPDKFAAIEQGLKLAPRRTSGLSVLAPQVADVSLTEVPYLSTDSTHIKVLASWVPPAQGLRFVVEWRLNLGEWAVMPQTSSNSMEIDGLVVGDLDVRVTTINSLGLRSLPKLKSLALQGWGGHPPTVDNFAASVSAAGVALTWSPLNVANYKETVISVGPTLVGALEIFRGAATNTTWHPPLTGSYNFWAQHVNTAGKASTAVATAGADWVARGNLGIRINADSFSGPTNYNECYVFGRNSAGVAVDGPGSILVNGVPTPVAAGPIYTNQGPVAAWIIWAKFGTPFSTGPGLRDLVMGRRVDGVWQYDDNNTGWVNFTLEPDRHFIIGEIETGGPDAGNPGAPPGVVAATMWEAASSPNTIAGLADVGYQAKTIATAAQTAASTAAGDASSALSTLATMRSNGYLDAAEKPAVIQKWQALSNELTGNVAQANAFGITSERDAYVTAINALASYLTSLSPSWDNTTTDTPITPAVDNGKWADVYYNRQVLLNKIADEAAKRANVLQISGLVTFRVIAAGYAGTPPATDGLYVQGTRVSGGARSYTMHRIRRSDGAVVFSRAYDVYADSANATALAADLNASENSVFVIVLSADEPQSNRLTNGLDTAMYRCGASRAVFGSTRFRSRSAYVLIGIPGCGEGNGAEAYQGAVDSDPAAWVDVSFQVAAGSLLGVTANYTPTSLQDYGYVGSLDATTDLVLTNRALMVIEGNTVSRQVGSGDDWTASVVSRDGYAGGAFVSFVPTTTTAYMMIGLNSDPTTDNSYTSLDFQWYVQGDGHLQARHQGDVSEWDGTYAAGDVLALTYDGSMVRWFKNGVLIASLAAAITAPLFLDSSFHTSGGKVTALRFGPLSSNAWQAIGGPDKPLDNAGKVIDTRSTNAPPSAYGVGNVREFKSCAAIGLSTTADYCTLETIKGWADSSGGSATQWAYITSGEIWKRSAPAGASAWGAWVRDLDRNLYTGDLDATRNKTYRQEGDPAVSPGGVIDGEDWQVPSTGRQYLRIAGAWLPIVGNGSVDTSQLATTAATDVTEFTFTGWTFSNIS